MERRVDDLRRVAVSDVRERMDGDAAVIDRDHPPSPDQRRGGERPNAAEVRDDGRGRSAESPAEIPARGWKDILLRVYRGISDDRILQNGAAVTFYALLALFPGIAALVSIYGLFSD